LDPAVSGVRVARASQVFVSAMLLFFKLGNVTVWHWRVLQWRTEFRENRSVCSTT